MDFLPDLFIHDSYFPYASKYARLREHFKIYSSADLYLFIHTDYPAYILTKETFFKALLQINPNCSHTKNTLESVSQRAAETSGVRSVTQKMFHISKCAPRYVIWNLSPLEINATIVDRVKLENIYFAFERAILWATNRLQIEKEASVAVFDLDETLIDSENIWLPGAKKCLDLARRKFDILVLWSHGSNLHVDENMCQINHKFDLVLSNRCRDDQSPKNLLHLYNYFPNVTFVNAVLIDDSLFNYTPEYNTFIVPTEKSLVHVNQIL